MAENKVTFGLCNVYYSKITFSQEGQIQYATPKPIPGAVSLETTARGDLIEFYADNMVYYSADNNQGYEGTLSIATVPKDFAIDVLGEEYDETDKVIHESSTAQTSTFALMFQFEGDVKATRHLLYNCSASRPGLNSSTKTDSTEPNQSELEFIASPRPGDYKVKTKTTSETEATVYNNWFTKVYEKTNAA